MKTRMIVTALLVLLVTAATGWTDEPFSTTMLRNMVYQSEWFDSGTVLLKDGSYTGDSADGVATRTVVRLADIIANGRLNDEPVAAVVLVTDAGGSGVFHCLAVVAVREGKPVNLAVTPLGDRVRVESLAIRENAIHVTMVSHGPDDPSCCPTQRVVKSYALAADELVMTGYSSPVPTGASSGEGEGLVGPVWQWVRFDGSDDSTLVVTDPGRYTVTFSPDGRLAIAADCNRGSGGYKTNGSSLAIPPFALTMAECPPESLSSRFLGYLGNVASFVLKEGTLYLNLRIDGGNLVFIKDPH